MDRRYFFKIGATAGGGLLLSTMLPFSCHPPLPETVWEPNFFLRLSSENVVTFLSSQSEIGQGTSTGLAMIAADELGARLEDIRIEFAPGSQERFGRLQDTGGSNGIRLLWTPLREAAAMTRELLKRAAAQKWDVEISELKAEAGYIHHKKSGNQLAFGQLVGLAATLPVPRQVTLKEKKDFQYIGQPYSGQKNKLIATGKTPYSINLKLPDMVYAAIERCPVWGGKLLTFDGERAKAFPGVIDVVEMEETPLQRFDYKGGVRPGVAVLAENTWAAFEAKKLLKIEWELGDNASKSSEDVKKDLVESQKEIRVDSFESQGAKAKYSRGTTFLNSTYESPFQVNACMEPLNATAFHQGNRLEIWAGTQAPSLTRERISEMTGLPEAAITVNNQPSGGGFGRRYFVDFVEEAVILSEKLRKPVKVTWSREDTFLTSKYHPYRTEFWSAALDQNKQPLALRYDGCINAPDSYRPIPYNLPLHIRQAIRYKEGFLIPRASWRSVFAHPLGLGLESFIDELAHEAGKDPMRFRLDLLDNQSGTDENNYPKRLKKTLEMVAEKSGWGQPKPEGIFQGVSAIGYNKTCIAQVANVSVIDGNLKIHKVTAVMDCGIAVNPSQVKSQVEGSIVWGLSALLKAPITVKNGVVQESNYDTYDLLRINESPEIEVHIIDSDAPPSGTGEPAVPGVAPAVMNAVFAATGKRYRDLPMLLT